MVVFRGLVTDFFIGEECFPCRGFRHPFLEAGACFGHLHCLDDLVAEEFCETTVGVHFVVFFGHRDGERTTSDLAPQNLTNEQVSFEITSGAHHDYFKGAEPASKA